MENSVALMRLLVPSPLASSGTPPQACEDTCGLVLISLSLPCSTHLSPLYRAEPGWS